MEVDVLEEHNVESCMIADGSSASLLEPRSRDIVAEADDNLVEEQCDHFSIRGYAALVRKRDPKFCSLFQIFHDQQQYDEHCSSLCPLSVTKFRRWDCRNCMDKVNILDNKTAPRAVPGKLDAANNDCSISFIRSTSMPINVSCKKLIPSTPQLSREANVERSTFFGSTTSDKKEIAEANTDPDITGLQVSLNKHDGTVNLSSNASTDVMATSEACRMTVDKEENDMENLGSPKSSEVIFKPNADENGKTQEVLIADCNTNIVSRPIPGHKGNHVANRGLLGEAMSKSTQCNRYTKYNKSTGLVGISDVKCHRKKVKKVRLLSEIINTCGVATSRNDQLDHRKHADLSEDGSSLIPLALERKDEIHVSHHTVGEIKLKTIKSKKKSEGLDVVDDGSPLMNWLKRTHKKLKTATKDSQKDSGVLATNSKSALHTSSSKYIDFNFEQTEADKCQQKLASRSMQHDAPYNHFLSLGGSLNKRKMPSTANIQRGDKATQNNCLKKNIHKTKNLCHIQSENSTQRYLSKVSPGKHGLHNLTDFHEQRIPKKKKKKNKKKKKKQKLELMHKMETIDGIPMDIVELLAKNQQERQLMSDTDGDVYHTFSKKTGGREDDCPSIATEESPNEVESLTLEKKQKLLQENVGSSIQTTIAHPRELQILDHLPSTWEKQAHLHKENAASIAISPPILPHNKDQHIAEVPPQSWSQKGTKKLMWDSFKTATRDSSLLPCNAQFRPSIQCVDLTFSHVRPASSNYLTQQPGMTTVDHCIKRTINQVQARSFPTAVSSTTEASSMCDRRIAGPSGLYTKETMPAMHLLRLMDSSNLAGLPHYETPNRNQMEPQLCHLYRTHSQYKGSISTSYGAVSNLNEKVTSMVEGFAQHQHQHNLHKPLRPLPRVGVLGSLLQKEITNWSENCGTQSGYRIGMSKGLSSFQMNRKEDFDALNSGMFSAKWNALQIGSVSSVVDPKFLSARDRVVQSWTRGKGKIAHPLDKFVTQDICATNRNPADFTTISNDNEYMITL